MRVKKSEYDDIKDVEDQCDEDYETTTGGGGRHRLSSDNVPMNL